MDIFRVKQEVMDASSSSMTLHSELIIKEELEEVEEYEDSEMENCHIETEHLDMNKFLHVDVKEENNDCLYDEQELNDDDPMNTNYDDYSGCRPAVEIFRIKHEMNDSDGRDYSMFHSNQPTNSSNQFSSELFHMKSEYNGNGIYKCEQCPRTFERKGRLTYHLLMHKQEKRSPEKRLKCKICGKYLKSNLENHMLIHSREKQFKCDTCGNDFYSKSSLRYHLLTHSEEKKFICSICQKGFEQKCNYDNHMRRHIPEKRFKCGYCDKTFCQKPGLKHHMLTHA